MHLTTHTDYAFRVLFYLAVAGDRRVTVGDIAKAYGISANHLMKVSQHLVRTGWVRSVRGRHGGLYLRKRPEAIIVGNVVRDMEGGFDLVACQADPDTCLITPICRLKNLLGEALEVFLEHLDRQTLADLLTPETVKELERDLLND